MANEIVQVPDDGDVTVRAMVANVLNAAWTEGLNRAEAYDDKVSLAVDGFLDMVNISNISAVQATPVPETDVNDFAIAPATMSLPTDIAASSATASSVSAGTAMASLAAGGYSATLTSAITALMEAVSASASSANASSSVPELASATSVVEPNVYIPYIADNEELWVEWWDKTLEIIELLVSEGARFAATYAPNESAHYEAVSDYLLAALANTGIGMPDAVVAQIMGDDQARIIAEKVRAQDAVIAQFASRGFPLPPGVSASAILQLEQGAQDAIAETSRKIAIMSIELQKFNIEKLIDLRKTFLSAMNDYIKSIASGPDIASKVLGTNYDAQQKLISSAAAWFNARISAAEAVNKVAITNASLATDVSKTNAALATDTSKVNAGLLTDVAKANASLSTEAAKTNASLATEISKANASLGTDVSKVNASLSADIDKANASLSTDVAKANMSAALDAAKTAATLATEISKTNAGLALDAAKASLSKDIEVGKVNAGMTFDAARTSAGFAVDLTKMNATFATDIGKFNVSEQNKFAVENLKTEMFMVEKKLAALLEQAKVIGTMGTALLNNIHAGLGINANRDTRVGYNYSNDTTGQPAGFSDVG